MEYRNLDLETFDYRAEDDGGSFRVRVAGSPAGEQRYGEAESVRIPADLRRRLRRLERRTLDLPQLIALGEELAALLFPPRARLFLTRSRARLDDDEGLRIRLKMHTYALADLPWEYVYIPPPDTPPDQKSLDGFLVLDRRVSLVRYEVMGQSPGSLDPVGGGPLRLVALLAAPEGSTYAELDLGAEQRSIERALSDVPDIRAEFHADATVETLEDALAREAHVFHFAGHGEFQGDMGTAFGSLEGEGALVLLDEDRGPFLFPAEKLAQNLRGRGVRLALLGACEGGRRDQVNAWTGVVPALIRAGIPAVVGMQYTIRDKNAVAFSRRFYRALAAGQTVDAAVTDGRLAIFNRAGRNERDWGVPVLYMRADEGVLFPGVSTEAEGAGAVARPAGGPGPAIHVEQTIGRMSGGQVVGVEVGKDAASPKSKARRELERELEEFEEPLAPAADDVDKWALREALVRSFSTEELEELCFYVQEALEQAGHRVMGAPVQVNLEILGGSGKRARVLNLIQFLDRRGFLGYLVEGMRKLRPGSI